MLKSFGCSFIFGTDLSDDGRDQSAPTFSQLTWPAHLARYLGEDYQCYARGGSGNLQIMDRALKHIASPDTDMYVIGWTWPARFDFNCGPGDWPGGKYYHENNKYAWTTLNPGDESELAEFYFTRLQSDYRDQLMSLMCINTVLTMLKSKNAKFIMTCMDETLFDPALAISPSVALLQQQIKPYVSWFGHRNFLDWSIDQGFAISDTSHPLEQAHEHAAKLVVNDLRNWIKQ